MFLTGGRKRSATGTRVILPSRKPNNSKSSSKTNKVNRCAAAWDKIARSRAKRYCATPVLPRWMTEVDKPICMRLKVQAFHPETKAHCDGRLQTTDQT